MTILFMIYMHILDDFMLQGILASMKQKNWWTAQEGYKPLYKYDYIVALLIHSFSWAFMIMLPIAVKFDFDVSASFYIALLVNTLIHCVVDDLKANKGKINLVIDQSIHIVQIVVTGLIFMKGV